MLFENMDVWKRSRKMAIEVYRQTTDLKDYGFKDQITRSALSVPSNIAEGLERSSIPDKCRFLQYAKGLKLILVLKSATYQKILV
jgi:four helix bundle protein